MALAATKQGPRGVVLSIQPGKIIVAVPLLRTYRILLRNSIVKLTIDVIGTRSVLLISWEICWTILETHIVAGHVAQNVVESLSLGDIFAWFANDNGKLDFVVGEMLLNGLHVFWDSNGNVWANQRSDGLVEKDGISRCR